MIFITLLVVSWFFRLYLVSPQIAMNKKMTIALEPPAIRSKILISAISLRIEANIDGNQRSKGSSSRMFLDFRLLQGKELLIEISMIECNSLEQIVVFLFEHLISQRFQSRHVVCNFFAELVEISGEKIRFNCFHLKTLDDDSSYQWKRSFFLKNCF